MLFDNPFSYNRKVNLKRFNRWLHNYVDNVDITNIEWLNFGRDELNLFFNNNYYDEVEKVLYRMMIIVILFNI